jgi:hypothetical protein
MAWDFEYGDGVPTDDDGRPIHPEKGYPVCGYPTTDAVDETHGRKRQEIEACLLPGGWGTDRDTGACRNHFGASPGGPTGWQNGNARHLLYSERMTDDDREIFDAVVQAPDGVDADLMRVEDMADMLKQVIGFEFTRLIRAIRETPGVKRVETVECTVCGETYKSSSLSPPPVECTGTRRIDGIPEPCSATRDDYRLTGTEFVDFGDKAVERKESHLSNLIDTYKRVADGVDVNLDGDMTHTGDGGGAIDVDISHVGVDLPVDETGDSTGDE